MSESSSPEPAARRAVFVALFFVLALVAYAPALSGGFIWDDDAYVRDNELLDQEGALGRIWGKPGATPQYYPMVFTSFWLENALWGRAADSTTGYHVVNVLLHALSGVLLWIALKRLRVPGALACGLVFTVHPVCVESVAWITERKNVLSLALYLGSFLCALRTFGLDAPRRASGPGPEALGPRKKGRKRQATTPEPPRSDPNVLLWWAASFALFGAALLSKSVTASLPAALILVIVWKRGRVTLNQLLSLVPFFAAGWIAGLHTAHIEETVVFGGEQIDLGIDGAEHVLLAGRIAWFYAGKLVWPFGLSFMYPRWELDVGSVVQWLYPITAVLLLVAAWLARPRFGGGPLTALLFFGGTLFPALGFIDVYPMLYAYVADHFQYHACIGLLALLIAAATHFGAKLLSPHALSLAGGLLVLGLAARTFDQCRDYSDLRTLWRATLARNPEALMAAINYSNMILREDEDTERANRILEQGLADVGAGVHPMIHARGLYNLGNNHGRLARPQAAVEAYRRALEVDRTYYRAHKGLGWALLSLGEEANARTHYEIYLKELNRRDLTDASVEELLRGRLAR